MKKIIVIGIQHSGTRYVCNVLTKHPNVEFKYHLSIPYGYFLNPMKQMEHKLDKDCHVIFVNRENNFILHSNDNQGSIDRYKEGYKKAKQENILCDLNIFKNYRIVVNDYIKTKLIPMNIPFSFFSIETYYMYKEFYLKDFFINHLKLDYNLYPMNLSGKYHYMKKSEKINDKGQVINEKGEVMEKTHKSFYYSNIEISNTNEKYYTEKKFWKTNGDMK